MTEIIVAVITGVATVLAVVITNSKSHRDMDAKLDKNQALMQMEINSMKTDIKDHNHYAKLFAETMPVIQEQIKVINHRLKNLEDERKGE